MQRFETYRKSLKIRLSCAEYHKLNLDEYFSQGKVKDKFIPISAEFTAMMLALHSSLDILAQCINIKGSINCSEKRVTFNKLIPNICKGFIENDIQIKILNLCNETRYLDGFCNVSKHRQVIKISDQHYFVSPEFPVSIIEVDEFSYRHYQFNSYDLKYAVRKNYSLVVERIKNILNDLEKL